jgi:hypothetical protein
MNKMLPKMIKAPAAGQNSLLTSFMKVQKREASQVASSQPSVGTESTSKSTPEEKKLPSNKREVKKASKGELYKLPNSYNHTHEHVNGEFKDGKVNIWMWNINGVNAVLTKGAL